MAQSDPTATEPPTKWGWFHRLRKHPIFPLLCLIPLTQAVRDEYPISHYPMYSQPTSRELRFQYVTGADDQPLPITWHTGITPSQVGKQYSRFKANLIKAEEKKTGQDLEDLTGELETRIKDEAGTRTLKFLRDLSLQRNSDRHLAGAIKLYEVTLGFGDGHFTESQKVVAQLPPLK